MVDDSPDRKPLSLGEALAQEQGQVAEPKSTRRESKAGKPDWKASLEPQKPLKSARINTSGLAFIVFAILGLGVLLFPWEQYTTPLTKFFVPIGFVILFAITGLIQKWYYPERGGQRFIDNVYYLGFFYTQFALMAGFLTLWVSSAPDPDGVRRITSDQLIPIIAAALGSTAFGLTFKIFFDELYEVKITSDGLSDEQVFRKKLVDASKELSQDAELVVGHFHELSETLIEKTNSMKSTVDASTDAIATLGRTQAKVEDSVSGLNPAIAGLIKTIGEAGSSAQQQVETSKTNLVDTIESLMLAIDALKGELVTAGTQSAGGMLQVKDDLLAAVQALSDVSSSARATVKLADDVGETIKQAGSSMETLTYSANTIQEQSDATLAEMRADIQDIVSSAGVQASESTQELSDLVSSVSSDADREIAKLREQLESVVRDASVSIDSEVSGNIEQLSSDLNSVREKLAEVIEQFNEGFDLITKKGDSDR